MNRFLKFLGIYVAFLIQSVILSNMRIISITPDLLSIAIVLTAVYCSCAEACFIGAFGGILTDVLCGRILGVNTLIYMYIALLTALLVDKKHTNSPVIMGWVIFVCITFFQVIKSFLYYFTGNLLSFGHIGKSILVNGVLAIVFTVGVVAVIDSAKRKSAVKEDAQ